MNTQLGRVYPAGSRQAQGPWWKTEDFWHDVAANMVAFVLIIALVLLVESMVGRRVEVLHT